MAKATGFIAPPPVVRSSKPKASFLTTASEKQKQNQNQNQNQNQRQEDEDGPHQEVSLPAFQKRERSKTKTRQENKPSETEEDEKTFPQDDLTESDERDDEQEKPPKRRKEQNPRQQIQGESPSQFKASSSGFGSAYSLKNKSQGGKQVNKFSQGQPNQSHGRGGGGSETFNRSRSDQGGFRKKSKPVVLDEIEEISYLGFNPADFEEDSLYYFPPSGINVEDIQKRGLDVTSPEFFDRLLWPERDSFGKIRVRSEQKGKFIVKTIILLRHPMSIEPSRRESKPFFPVVWFLPNARSATPCGIQTAKSEKNGIEEEFFTCAFNLVLGWVHPDQSHQTNYYFTFFSSLEDWHSKLVTDNQEIFETGKKFNYNYSLVNFVKKFNKKTQKEKTYPPKFPFKIKFRRPYEPDSNPEILWNEIKFIKNRKELNSLAEVTEAGFFDWTFKTCVSCVEVVLEGYTVTNLGVFGRNFISRIAMIKGPKQRLRQVENSDFDNLLEELNNETDEAEIEDKKKENTFAGGPETSLNRTRTNWHASTSKKQQAQDPEKQKQNERQKQEQARNQKTRLHSGVPAKMITFESGIGKLPIPGSVGSKRENTREPTKKQKKKYEETEEMDVDSSQDTTDQAASLAFRSQDKISGIEEEPDDVTSQREAESQQQQTETAATDLDNSQLESESKEKKNPKSKSKKKKRKGQF